MLELDISNVEADCVIEIESNTDSQKLRNKYIIQDHFKSFTARDRHLGHHFEYLELMPTEHHPDSKFNGSQYKPAWGTQLKKINQYCAQVERHIF